jgi:hypothetical protein
MNKRLVIYISCILLLEWFCLINAYVFDLKGASVDATKFQDAAISWARFGHFGFVIDAAFYSQLLGLLYLFVGKSEFIGAQFNVLALAVGAIYFERILRFFRVERTYFWVVPFLLWPSLLTRATTTLREPILICFTVLIVYNVLRFQRDRRVLNVVGTIVSCLCAALVHKAYAVVSLALIPYVLFFVMKRQGRFYRSGVFYARVGLGVLFLSLLFVVYRDFGNVRGLEPALALMSGDVDYMQSVVESKTEKAARATYAVGLDFSSVGSIAASYPLVFLYYVFSPFPWMVTSAYDAYASLEGAFRMAAFLCLFAAYRKSVVDRRKLGVVFVVLMALLMVWAAGTVNYGTASRHHTTTIWIFLLFVALALRKESVSMIRLPARA